MGEDDCKDPDCAMSKGMNSFYSAVQSRISEGHWIVIASGVNSPFEPGKSITIAYTVGLMAKDLPELVVYGIPLETAFGILNDAAELLIKGELKLDTPQHSLSNYPVIFKQVEQDLIKDIFGLVRTFSADGKTANLWQLVWPDTKGLFPWDSGFDESLRCASLVHYRTIH